MNSLGPVTILGLRVLVIVLTALVAGKTLEQTLGEVSQCLTLTANSHSTLTPTSSPN